MPIRYKILPERSLVYVKYWGATHVTEARKVFEQFEKDPQAASLELTHLVDLSDLDALHLDPKLMEEFQAQKNRHFQMDKGHPRLVYYAPNDASQTLVEFLHKHWGSERRRWLFTARTEGEALELAGHPDLSMSELGKSLRPTPHPQM